MATFVDPDGQHLAEDLLDDLLIAGREEIRQILDRQPGFLETLEQLEVDLFRRNVQTNQSLLDRGDHRGQRRYVEHHGDRPILSVERQCQLPFLDELVGRRVLCRGDPPVIDSVGLGRFDHSRIKRIEDQLVLTVEQLLLRAFGSPLNEVGVVEEYPHVANPPNTGVGAGRRLTGLHAREAEYALLGLAGGPVVEDFLVRAGRDTHPPGSALVLVDQHNTVLATLVDSTARTGSHTGRVQAVVADTREVVEHHPLDLCHLLLNLGRHVLEVGIVGGVNVGSGQVVIPVRTGFDIDGIAGDCRNGYRRRLVFTLRRVEQVLVAECERFVVVVQFGQGRVVEQIGKSLGPAVKLQLDPNPVFLPAAAIVFLILPPGWIAGTRSGFDVVPPHVLGALAVGPQVLARDAARMAADALVEVEQHAHMGSDIHDSSSQ